MDILGVDSSLWDFRLDVPYLKSVGVETVVVKIGSGGQIDPKFYKNAPEVVKGGLNLQVYYWPDIILDPSSQADWVVNEIKKSGLPITFVWMDAEQWWLDWAKWSDARAGKIPYSQVPTGTPANISHHFETISNSVNNRIPGKVGVYTNWGFMSSWARPMTSWIGKFPLWDPQYVNQPARGYVCEWAELKAKWVPTVWPVAPLGSTQEKMVGYQFTGDAFELPGIYDELGRRIPLDINLFKSEFMASIKDPVSIVTPVVIAPVSVIGKYVVTVALLNIRTGPSTDYAFAGAALPKNVVVDVTEVVGSWAHLVSGAWCYAPYLSSVIPGPSVPEKYIVNIAWLNIRTGAGASYPTAGTPMPMNTVVDVVEVPGDWAHLTTGTWCYFPYLKRVT